MEINSIFSSIVIFILSYEFMLKDQRRGQFTTR